MSQNPPLPTLENMYPDVVFDYEAFIARCTPTSTTVSIEKQRRLLTHCLYSSWAGPGNDRRWSAYSNVGFFHSTKLPPVVPDSMLFLDYVQPANLRMKENLACFWWDIGKSPDIAIEVVSNENGGEDTDKLRKYAKIGVPYYAIYDRERLLSPEPLRVFVRTGSDLIPTDQRFFPALGLGLTLWHGAFENLDSEWLRWTDPAGDVIPTGEERAASSDERALIAEGVAAIERQRAENERQKAEAERQRAERLAVLLKQMGVSIDE
jgi:Uma2 family endonuclease